MNQQHQPTEDVDHHDQSVEHPQVVQVLDDLLELGRDVDVDVVIEARLHRTKRRQRRPIVRPTGVGTVHQFGLPTFQFLGLLFQLILAPLLGREIEIH